jgi:hypothetical protein
MTALISPAQDAQVAVGCDTRPLLPSDSSQQLYVLGKVPIGCTQARTSMHMRLRILNFFSALLLAQYATIKIYAI